MAKILKTQPNQLTDDYSDCTKCANGTVAEYGLIDCKELKRFPSMPNCLELKIKCAYFTKINR